jgi:hypothetical protein
MRRGEYEAAQESRTCREEHCMRKRKKEELRWGKSNIE